MMTTEPEQVIARLQHVSAATRQHCVEARCSSQLLVTSAPIFISPIRESPHADREQHESVSLRQHVVVH